MHFEVLVEDQSGKKALDILILKIIGDQHTFRVIEYRGIGHIPKNLKSSTDASNKAHFAQPTSQVAQGIWKDICRLPGELSSSSDCGLRSG